MFSFFVVLTCAIVCCCHAGEFTTRREWRVLKERGPVNGDDVEEYSITMKELDFFRDNLYVSDNEEAVLDSIDPESLTLEEKKNMFYLPFNGSNWVYHL